MGFILWNILAGILRMSKNGENGKIRKIFLAEIGLSPGMTFMDMVAGQAIFYDSCCMIVGDRGKVYASDISQTNINKATRKGYLTGLTNVIMETVKAEELKL